MNNISSDGKVVWINGSTGCLARFYRTSAEYFGFEKTETVLHTGNNVEDWINFVNESEHRFGAFVDRYKPGWVSIEKTFQELKHQWYIETAFLSGGLCETESAKKIIALGLDAVPYIVEEMKIVGGHWFGFLEIMLGDGPEIPEESRGKIKEINQIWLDWIAEWLN